MQLLGVEVGRVHCGPDVHPRFCTIEASGPLWSLALNK